MITSKELTFTRFYIMEFLQEVEQKIPQTVNEDRAGLARELIGYLIKQDDVADGIELIAREQGSGELSIFLFDIVDRIEDYPPTVAYDALPDIVEDFVSGLDLMLEEEETVAAIQKVNQRFREDLGEIADEKPVEMEPELETEAVAEVVDESAGMDELPPEEAAEPAEPDINFEQYFEREFFQKLSDQIDDTLDSDISSPAKSFMDILFENISNDPDSASPKSLLEALGKLRSALPWRTGDSYSPSALVANQPVLLTGILENLRILAERDQEIITTSVMQARLVIPEAPVAEIVEETPESDAEEEPVQEFTQEEIPRNQPQLTRFYPSILKARSRSI